MTPPDPHPEALLELRRQGRLSEVTRSELSAHLEQCAACAAEVWASTLLVRDCEPRAGDSELDRLAVQATLAKLAARPIRVRRQRRAWVWALAAALPLCALAGVGAWFSSRAQRDAAPPVAPSDVSLQHSIGAPSAAAPSASEATATDSPVSSPSSGLAPVPAPRLSGRSESLGPSELLRRAGDLDREGKRAQAIEVYRELEQRFAASLEAKLSHVLVGSLLLAQGKYRQAIAHFDRYLADSGPASEEALAGRATALQALGDQSAEAASWRLLLERFPSSVHASNARQRLTTIAASAPATKSP